MKEILRRLQLLVMVVVQITTRGHEFDGTVAERFGYADRAVQQLEVQLLPNDEVDGEGWLAVTSHSTDSDFYVSLAKIKEFGYA